MARKLNYFTLYCKFPGIHNQSLQRLKAWLIIRNGKDVEVAAVEATIQLLSKGGSFEHQQLVKANPDVLTVALELHDRRSQRQHSLKLLHSIVTHLSYTLLLHEDFAREMFTLFE